ncbi:hypothetical protein [Geothrix edaphica]|uniref:Uncharacterized protein n=1 Tax=Geothrix edaphica TaxID=2927976 RepID=A0ABQ5Q040_9BACT|nr:hypothetical protein [Geothrix edaphica]GLH67740.1 hypothetical protein GETHED_21040 [Geothrix edaphica]
MSKDFLDIKMTGFDEKASRPVEQGSPIFRMLIDLSGAAPSEWAQYFNQRWSQHFYMRKRRAHVSGNSLTIECVPDELERDHIPELKKVIAETNAAYAKYHAQRQQERAEEEAKKASDSEKLAQIKKTIKFD